MSKGFELAGCQRAGGPGREATQGPNGSIAGDGAVRLGAVWTIFLLRGPGPCQVPCYLVGGWLAWISTRGGIGNRLGLGHPNWPKRELSSWELCKHMVGMGVDQCSWAQMTSTFSSMHLPVHLFIYLSTCLSMYPFVHLRICTSIHPSVYLFVCIAICLSSIKSVDSSIHLSEFLCIIFLLSVCLFVFCIFIYVVWLLLLCLSLLLFVFPVFLSFFLSFFFLNCKCFALQNAFGWL